MAWITIQDLPSQSIITDLDDNDFNSISGGCTGNFWERAGCYTGKAVKAGVETTIEAGRTAKRIYDGVSEGRGIVKPRKDSGQGLDKMSFSSNLAI